MNESATVKMTKSEGVATISLARPKHNVFNIEMMNLFCSILQDLNNDKDLKCIVIKGEGPSWCAGVDVGDHRPEMADEMIAESNVGRLNPMVARILAQEPVEVQRAVLAILTLLKSIAKSSE